MNKSIFSILCILLIGHSFLCAEIIQHLDTRKDSLINVNRQLERIKETYKKEGKVNSFIQTSITIAINQNTLEDYQGAIRQLEGAIEFAEDSLDNQSDTILALAYHKLGVNYYYLYDDENAIKYYKKALEIRENVFGLSHPDVIKGYLNIGIAYKEMEKYDTALQYLLPILKIKPNPETLAKVYKDLGNIYGALGDIQKEKQYLFFGLDIYKILHNSSPREIASFYIDIIGFYEKQDSFYAMIFYSEKALTLINSIDNKNKKDYFSKASCYNNLALAYEGLDFLDKSLEYYQKSIAINEKYSKERKEKLAIN